jgi:hypothetical protein
MQVDPEEHQRQKPEKLPVSFPVPLGEYPETSSRQEKHKHVGAEKKTKPRYGYDQQHKGSSQKGIYSLPEHQTEDDQKRYGNDQCFEEDQPVDPADTLNKSEEHIRKPVVGLPGGIRSGERKGVSVRNLSVLNDPLTSLQVPPNIVIVHLLDRKQESNSRCQKGKDNCYEAMEL